jgi:hypothetical protein
MGAELFAVRLVRATHLHGRLAAPGTVAELPPLQAAALIRDGRAVLADASVLARLAATVSRQPGIKPPRYALG